MVEARIDINFWIFLEMAGCEPRVVRQGLYARLARVGLPRGLIHLGGCISRTVGLERTGQKAAGHLYRYDERGSES